MLAFVVLKPGGAATPEELAVWCEERLADYKVPRYLHIVETLPKTATQKVEKARLRADLTDRAVWYDHEAARARG